MFGFVIIVDTGNFFGFPDDVAQNEKRKRKLFGFSYSINMANFEAFLWNFSSSTNPEIIKYVQVIIQYIHNENMLPNYVE